MIVAGRTCCSKDDCSSIVCEEDQCREETAAGMECNTSSGLSLPVPGLRHLCSCAGEDFNADTAIVPLDSLSRQALEAQAKDMAIEDALYALDKALQHGTITSELYLKQVSIQQSNNYATVVNSHVSFLHCLSRDPGESGHCQGTCHHACLSTGRDMHLLSCENCPELFVIFEPLRTANLLMNVPCCWLGLTVYYSVFENPMKSVIHGMFTL